MGSYSMPVHPQYTLAVCSCIELNTAFIFAGIYAGLVGSAMIMSFARAILFFYVCVRAAKKLHNKMLTAVLRVPVRFFDVNPIGE